MQLRIHGRRKRSPDTPWLLVATLIGVIIVVGAAFTYFTNPDIFSMGSKSSSTASTSKSTSTSSVATVTVTSTQGSEGVVVATPTAVTIPSTGVTIGVNYIGGFNGSYTTAGVTTAITPNSGSQTYQVENATKSVTAIFQKTDETATHALTVTIYENGKQLASNSTSAAYGKVAVTATL